MQAGTALLVAIGMLPILAGCGGEASARAAGREAPPPRPVKVVPAVETGLPRVVTVTGTLAAEEQVALGMKVAGRLEAITVDLGSRAVKGATLARLAPVDFQLRVRQSEAIVEQARARLGLEAGAAGDDVDPTETPLVGWSRRTRSCRSTT
jgi:multidrug efflux pump subunit AcrA (membrane-fusion protein)